MSFRAAGRFTSEAIGDHEAREADMTELLEGKTAIIYGGGGGIGRWRRPRGGEGLPRGTHAGEARFGGKGHRVRRRIGGGAGMTGTMANVTAGLVLR
jgi:hypothetical protein